MKEETEWEVHDEESSPREKIEIHRMKWDPVRMTGTPMTSDGGVTLFGHLEPEWIEETEKQKMCGYWTEDNRHPFRKEDGKTCVLCGARKI